MKKYDVWNLNDILPVEKFDELYDEIEKEMPMLDEWFGKLDPEMSTFEFKKLIDFEEKLDEKMSRLGTLPSLMKSVNQKDERAKLLQTKVENLVIKISPESRLISHWFQGKELPNKKTLDDKNAKRLFASIPDLKYVMNYSRLAGKYTLDHEMEELILNKDINGIGVVSELRSLITTDFEYRFEVKNKKVKLFKTQSEILSLIHSRKAEERKAAYLGLLNVYRNNIQKLFTIYQAVVKDWGYEAKLRGYESPIAMRNFDNQIPNRAIEILLKVCTDNKKIFQDYFKYKAKLLKLNKLRRFDIYAPTNNINKKINYEEAKELIFKIFGEFSPKFGEYARKIFDEKHVHSHPKINKRDGAFCSTIFPNITPYVLTNFTDRSRDLFTLAHELGHGIHSLYANHHYSASQHAGLPLAETASTMAEMIVFEKLYKGERDIKIKKSMLFEKMNDAYAIVLRQNYFLLFEVEAHKLMAKGTTVKDLSELYYKNLKEQFGDSVQIDPIFKYEWAYISHFFSSPFYVYAYNFGELLSYALFDIYKKEGNKFMPKLEKILESGGSRNPQEVLKEVGIDITDVNFWQGSFEIIKEWMTELKKL